MTQDRGRNFYIDANDIYETGYILTLGNIMGEFQRTQLLLEIAAYRLAALAITDMNVDGDTNVEYSYIQTSKDIIQKIKTCIKTIRNNVKNSFNL